MIECSCDLLSSSTSQPFSNGSVSSNCSTHSENIQLEKRTVQSILSEVERFRVRKTPASEVLINFMCVSVGLCHPECFSRNIRRTFFCHCRFCRLHLARYQTDVVVKRWILEFCACLIFKDSVNLPSWAQTPPTTTPLLSHSKSQTLRNKPKSSVAAKVCAM